MKIRGLGSPIYDADTGEYLGEDYSGDASMSGGDNSTIYTATGGTPPASGTSGWLDTLVGKLPQISAFLTAQQVQQINIRRAQQGLTPITGAQYGPNVAVGLDPGMQQLIHTGLVWGLGFLAVKMVLGSKRK